MMKKTHLLAGIVLTSTIICKTNIEVLPAIVGLTGATIPDYDIALGLKHRGLSHSFLLSTIVCSALTTVNVGFAISFYLNWLVHIFLDSFTKMGVPLFAPFSNKMIGVKIIKTNGAEEGFIFLLILFAISLVLK